MEAKKHSWHGPKQIGMMIYTAILFLIGTSIIGGNNNTVFPMFSEIRGWDVNVINVVSGLACIAKAIGVLVLARVVRKTGAKNLTTVTLILSALLLIVFGTTIHRITASKVFHTPFEEVTDLQRRNAKAVNFGIVYGISSFGLSQDLSITRKEAATYIEQYFATYPQVKTFLDKQVEDAKQNGYVTTLYGRRRPIPELKSSNFMQRSFGERVAMNSPIQGTAADIMKLAMIHVWEELHRRKLNSRLSLQIHDELLIETDRAEATEVAELLKDKMKHAAELSVSLEVDLHTGENWYDAK